MSINLKERLSLAPNPARVSSLANDLSGSAILKIAYEVRDRVAQGADVLNLTVGDFDSHEFPVPSKLADEIKAAVDQGHTNYPPSNGVLSLREAVVEFIERRLELAYPVESVLIAGGSRPLIAGVYLAVVDPKDRVVYGTPSWNNNAYCTLVGAHGEEISTDVAHRFFPTAEAVLPRLAEARLVCLNSPQNPTGTVIPTDTLRSVCEAIVQENRKRTASNKRPVYLMYDQVYWMLTFEGAHHETPVSLVPEVAPYTILIDGISKNFAGTGVRVGWAVGPTDVIARMNALSTHLGSWAPKPEQVATARLLRDHAAIDAYLEVMRAAIHARLSMLDHAISELQARGHPVRAISPQGAIYLSMHIDLRGRKTPEGQVLNTDEDIRGFLLRSAGIALVPFGCFGVPNESGWFRASVGAVSEAGCRTFKARLERALESLGPQP
ncbi:MAG: pyridoxal phosphate-dependent aminotransferase [Deltaproteobacteria bacterium]|nr:pyridoxal phosphate-dependent aminotransferase [Deltaproteobacteria bacterium]